MTTRLASVPVVPHGKKRDKQVTALDGMVVDLFKRVESPLSYAQLSTEEHMESIKGIQRILSQIQKHERTHMKPKGVGDVKVASGIDRLEALRDWLQREGIKTDGLRFEQNLPEGSGVIASRALKRDEIIATLGQDKMMTTVSAIQSDPDVAILFATDKWFRAVPSLILTMHLLFQKHKSGEEPSRWAGYIASLPGQDLLGEFNAPNSDGMILPLAFSMHAVELLKETSALSEFHKMLRTVAKQYCHMRTVLHQLVDLSPSIRRAADSWFTFAEFRWAVSTVMMRQNEVPILVRLEKDKKNLLLQMAGQKDEPNGVPEKDSSDGAKESSRVEKADSETAETANGSDSTLGKEGGQKREGIEEEGDGAEYFLERALALIPVLDMFNHEEGPITCNFSMEQERMEVVAKRDFKEGEQVFISYGYRPNAMLLLYAGFIPSTNQRDRIRLPVELPPSEALYNKKLGLLKWLELPPSALFDLFWDGTPSEDLSKWLKAASAADEEEITRELRAAIATKTNETQKALEERLDIQKGAANGGEKQAPSAQNSHPHHSTTAANSISPKIIPEVALSKGQAALLKVICQKKLSALKGSSSTTESRPKSMRSGPLGLGLSLERGGKQSVVCSSEIDLLMRYRDSEIQALIAAVQKCDSVL